MRTGLDILKSLLIGGLLFLMPFGIVLVVFGKLLAVSLTVGHALHGAVLPGVDSDALILLIAVLVLLALALAAGIFARTKAGLALFAWLERTILARLPVYTILRQTIADLSDGQDMLGQGSETRVVAIHMDDHTAIGFFIDRTPAGRVMVYLPGAPSALSGSVAVVDAERVADTDITAAQLFAGMRRLGAGLAAAGVGEAGGGR